MCDRFKLAEAMGWKTGRTDTVEVMGRLISHMRWIDLKGNDRAYSPDPFTDANDDYAVLEWMRNNPARFNDAECETENHGWAWKYKIGDYARAALKVIDD